MPDPVPFHDFAAKAAARGNLWARELERAVRELAWTRPSSAVARLEEELAAACGTRHAIATSSGTTALLLTMLAHGLGPGRSVVTVGQTFVATVAVGRILGGTPVLVDVDRDSYTMDPANVADAVDDRTVMVLPVHLYGRPADVAAVARQAGDVPVVEEACQAFGATVGGRPVGSLGRAAVFSFGREKAVAGLGEGGAVVTDDDELAVMLRRLANQGRDGDDYVMAGMNVRIDPLAATVLRIELEHASADLGARRDIAARYSNAFRDLGIVRNPIVPPGVEHGCYTYVVEVPERSSFCAALDRHGVGWRIHYERPVHGWSAHRDLEQRPLPVTDLVASRVVSLPLRPTLADEQVDRVITAVIDACATQPDPARSTVG